VMRDHGLGLGVVLGVVDGKLGYVCWRREGNAGLVK